MYVYVYIIFYHMSILYYLIPFYSEDHLLSPYPNFHLNSEMGIMFYVSPWTCDINRRVVTLAHRVFTSLPLLSTDPFFFSRLDPSIKTSTAVHNHFYLLISSITLAVFHLSYFFLT